MISDTFSVNGVPISPPDTAAERAIVLPSGRRATIRRGFGRDLMRAQRAAQTAEPAAIIFALIAELAKIDGAPFLYEDVLAMDLADVMMLQEEVVGGNFPAAASPTPPSSPDSSASASDSRN
jgi:hypothetical protein